MSSFNPSVGLLPPAAGGDLRLPSAQLTRRAAGLTASSHAPVLPLQERRASGKHVENSDIVSGVAGINLRRRLSEHREAGLKDQRIWLNKIEIFPSMEYYMTNKECTSEELS